MIQPTSVSEQLLFTTVRIETEYVSGDQSWGTGFFFTFPIDGQRTLPVIVTNRHVIEGGRRGRFSVHEAVEGDANAQLADTSVLIELDDFDSRWIGHPDPNVDLCGMPFQPLVASARQRGKNLYAKQFRVEDVLTDEKMADLTAVEDILMIGYPNALWDEANNLPLLRRGITSSHPGLDFCGKPEFVIDCACFPGSSGSPVVLFNNGSYVSKNGNITVGGGRFALLGLLHAGPYITAEGEIVVGSPSPTAMMPVSRTNLMINLGYVIKAREILVLGERMKSLLVRDDPAGASANG